MKINYLIYSILILASFIYSCSSEDETELAGNWSEQYDFDGVPRSDAVGFIIDGKPYIGTGYDGEDRLNDFWEYNPTQNYWTQKADFPGTPRNGAIGMGIDGKGYIGTGYDGDNKLNDFWEYNPETNSWTQKADFAGSARYGAVCFTVDDKGYVGCGYDDNHLKDFYEYSPAKNEWTKIISIGGSKRRDATAFSVNGKGYVVSGIDNGTYLGDLWEYDPATSVWTEKRKITDYTDEDYDDEYTSIARINGVAFNVNGKVYLACGSKGSILNNVWEYDPISDLWTEKTAFEGAARTEAVGFGIGSTGYITTGRSSSYYFDDIWSFDPDAEYDENY